MELVETKLFLNTRIIQNNSAGIKRAGGWGAIFNSFDSSKTKGSSAFVLFKK